jgi:hypothetical protein
MSDQPQGEGDSQKTDGNGEQGESKKFTKDDLTSKFRAGRDEGIQKGVKDALGTLNDVLNAEFESLDDVKSTLPEMFNSGAEQEEVVNQLQNKLKEKDQTIQNLQGKVQDFRVSNKRQQQIKQNIGDRSLKVDLEDAEVLFNTKYGYVEEGGELYATENGNKIMNDEGNFATVGEQFAKFAETKGLFSGNAKGGAGGGTQAKSKAGKNNPFQTGNLTEQARLYRDDREAYDRLKAEANK